MKRRWKSKVSVLVLAVSLFIQTIYPSYTFAEETTKKNELELLQEEINERNAKLDALNTELDLYKYDFSNDKPKFSKQDLSLIKEFQEKNIKKKITVKNAKKEIKWLFRLLRSRYGLYTYYGGDEKFEKQEQNILEQLGNKGKIKTKDYQELIYQQLNFIEDSHFIIGDKSYSPYILLFSNEEINFLKRDNEFFKSDNTANKIISIEGKSPEDYLKRAIDQEGKLTYYLYFMNRKDSIFTNKDRLELTINYEDNTSETVTLKPAKYAHKTQIDKIYGYSLFNDKIPMMELNIMVHNDGGDFEKERNDFLNDVEKVKQSSNLILDLRNNPGGDSSLPGEWFKLYTGQKLQHNFSTLRIAPSKNWTSSEKEYDKLFVEGEGMTKEDGYYVEYPEKQFIKEHNTRFFVLTSRQTGSAAEGFTDTFHNLSNAIIIGTNTGGVFINMANSTFALPYSGLRMQFGECLMNYDKDYFRECYGFEPDIYLTGENLDTRLEKFFDTYVVE